MKKESLLALVCSYILLMHFFSDYMDTHSSVKLQFLPYLLVWKIITCIEYQLTYTYIIISTFTSVFPYGVDGIRSSRPVSLPSFITFRVQDAKLDLCPQGKAEVRILDFKTTWSEFQRPSQTAAERGKAKLCTLNFRTTWSEFQKPSQTATK